MVVGCGWKQMYCNIVKMQSLSEAPEVETLNLLRKDVQTCAEEFEVASKAICMLNWPHFSQE